MMSGDGFSSPPPLITNPNPTCSNSAKRKRNLPGNPDPDAEIIALSPQSLMATNRFVCEICSKGFQRDQNLQLHRRGHNLPWKLKQRNKLEVVRKKVYICPEISCVHHDPCRALGDLTGVKKHFSRKHGEKKWKCEKCSKKYAVKSDWKAHSKICGTKEYRCDCGTLFSRKDSFITHRAFCDPLTEENSRMASFAMIQTASNLNFKNDLMMMNNGGGGVMNQAGMRPGILPIWLNHNDNNNNNNNNNLPLGNSTTGCSSSFFPNNDYDINVNNGVGGMMLSSSEMVQLLSRSRSTQETVENFWLKQEEEVHNTIPLYSNYPAPPPPNMSATALLQKASQMGSTTSGGGGFELVNTGDAFSPLHQKPENPMSGGGMMMRMMGGSGEGNLTRDFLGVEEGSERREFSLQQELMKFSCWMNDSSVGFSAGGNDHDQ
ncbi:hypothetical protein SSX86_002593 [Deinandra increscens subsp. villosa]|uniref:C2H2-type domain-containing protein n=1 Tax=Deinandra increscens subsp. villosa TaxID=3103831 RepID=A0AAP0DNY2_9ASTR